MWAEQKDAPIYQVRKGEGLRAAKLEPDTPATFSDSTGVAFMDDKDGRMRILMFAV